MKVGPKCCTRYPVSRVIGLDSKVVTSASYMSAADILIKVIPDSIVDQNDDVIEDLDV